MRLDLGQVKEVKNRLGGTINDVVLATVVGAVRRFLRQHGTTPEDLNFRALIPVNVRSQQERGALGNRVAQMVAHLSLAEAEPRRVFQSVVEATQAVKHSHQVEATELIEEVSDWTTTGLLTQLIRFAASRLTYNLIVTNVPGPAVPLYLLGAPLRHSFPMVPLFRNQGLGIALFSYDGGLYWGINADWETVPDLHDFAEALEQSFRDLYHAALIDPARRRPAKLRRATGARRAQPRIVDGRAARGRGGS